MNRSPDPLADIAAAFDGAVEPETLTLRALAMQDPPRGAPARLHDGAGDEVMVEPGDWRGPGWIDRRTGLPLGCPVVPLGSMGADFYFLNTLGQVHAMQAASFGKGPIEALFQGRSGWLEWAWPRWTAPRSKSDIPRVKGYEADEARMDLINACAFKGTFQLEDRVRGRGAWRGDDGALILHAGDAVWLDGRWRPPGEHGRHIYPARPRIGRPATRAAGVGPGSAGAVLLQALQSWAWARGELDARLALGWTMSAMVGGALAQRPVCFVTGAEGVGKSTLQQMLRALFQGGLIETANTTPAGIYQRLGQDSLAVLADEMEAKEDTRTTDKIIELARISFSGDSLDRGGKDGVASRFRLMSSFLFSCIAAPPIDAQDASRRVALALRKREATAPDVLAQLGLKDASKLGELGAALMRRWVERWSTWDPLRLEVHTLLREHGHDARSADAFAPLVAACHLALHDGPPTDAQLLWWVERLEVTTLEETAGREDTWRRCFLHMLTAPSDLLRKNNMVRSVGAILDAWREWCAIDSEHDSDSTFREHAKEVATELERVGLSLIFPKGAEHTFAHARLWVPIKHPALHGLFAGTPWAGRLGQPGPWYGVLQQAPEDLWSRCVSGKGLNKAARGLQIELAAALEG